MATCQERVIAIAQQLSEILAQLDPVYNPQKAVVQKQLDALPDQQAAEQAGLDQAKNNAFDQINVQANDRGMSYSGLPITEQAKYTGATYLPAAANLKNTYANKGFALQDSLAQLEADKMKQAQGVYASETNAEAQAAAQVRAEQIKAQAARAANPGLDLSALMGGNNPAKTAAPTVQDHLTADIQNLIPSDYATRFGNGYTERQITRLQAAYPELDKNAIKAAVYGYRKQLTGT